ncbi:hypothetical protein JYU34_003196 [Plutella xylostella]|uniref:Uncharacterized protein n=1 Tax=Plutella xylostella TaxID=51655 RepID=A0ABQ7QZD7_PLUXY|nr:hypothetical protein JYU34_003196 [Plutella xylostella]
MGLLWLWLAAACMVAGAIGERGGASLRSALEALQRRQRGRSHGPLAPLPDYDAVYEYLPQAQPYSDPDYISEVEEDDDIPSPPKYIIKYLDANIRPPEAYTEYKIIKKKMGRSESAKKESAFRERSHHSDNDRLKDLFMDRNDIEVPKEPEEGAENDAEYAMLLSQLWSKYRSNNRNKRAESSPQGVVKLYNEKVVKKRYPDNWGPIAFKRKRSSGPDPVDHPILKEYPGGRKPHGDGMPVDPNYNAYDLTEQDKDDIREEYAIAFQPLEDDTPSPFNDNDLYAFDNEVIEKRFPVTKRSSGSYEYGLKYEKKRSAQDHNKRETSKSFRSSSGTDPRIIKDLSKIFGEVDTDDLIKAPVKRSSDQGQPETYKPPQVTVLSHNETHPHDHAHDMNATVYDVESHEQHGHLHHPGMLAKDADHAHPPEHHDHAADAEKPINVKKKSIDWSDYFGIDKRKNKAFVNDYAQEKLKKQYFNTFNKEVIYPLNSFRQHSKVKRNFVEARPNEETEFQVDSAHAVEVKTEEKRDTSDDDNTKIDNIDKKLKNMEGMIVDDALHYSYIGEELDSKEEQEMKEKLLSKLAAAYSLEKMRKALKEFKQSLQIQKTDAHVDSSPTPTDEAKAKRVAVKKEKANLDLDNDIRHHQSQNEDFEEEQGAGHYLNGKMDKQLFEGYMGGSGRYRIPELPPAVASGTCPVLTKIVQRCREVDLLAGDRGQLFLPLCSLHQICYLCGEAPPTTCDLVFLSEADTACEGDMGCQRAARAALMTLRELHDSLSDELDGECEASPCLSATLKMNLNWQRAIQR